jgi:formylglycine-generating enzyme required for sulfatase activity
VYTVPGEDGWQIVLNRSTTQRGNERFYSGDVAAQEIGRADVESRRTSSHVESFTMRTEGSGDMITLILEWENTLVTIPIRQVQ